jgi:hypothetical protein
VLIQLAEFARLRGDHAAAVVALEEASALGKQLGAWGDLSHIGGKLAAVRLRVGDLAAARADLERAEREEAARGIGQSDAATWLGLVRAELLYREGDTAAAGRICATVAQLEEKQSSWWFGVQDHQARLALIALADGTGPLPHPAGGSAPTATSWVLPPVADVIDAIAVLAQHSGCTAARPCPAPPTRSGAASTKAASTRHGVERPAPGSARRNSRPPTSVAACLATTCFALAAGAVETRHGWLSG